MNLSSFARELVTTGELDPIYTLLHNTDKSPVYGREWTLRFAMYFLMFYDAQGAAQAAELDGEQFWKDIEQDFDTRTRGKERRHFRGANGRASFTSLRSLGTPETAFLTPTCTPTLPSLVSALRANRIVGFGPYLSLKWADFADAILQYNMDYSALPDMLPDPPRKAIEEVFPGVTLRQGMDAIVNWIDDLWEPFGGYRRCGYSEAETIACAIPTYVLRPKYKMGDDIRKYQKQLADFPLLIKMLP